MPLPTRLPTLYMGTMTFGWSQTSSLVDAPTAAKMLSRFAMWPSPHVRVDTARIYSGGATEPIVREALNLVSGGVPGYAMLGTKAHPSQTGGLSADGIRTQLAASLDALGVDRVEEFYLHQPDPQHNLLESLRCTDELVRAGTVRRVGLSNYHASEVARAFALCDEHQLARPTVYQGLYNPLNRIAESELLPVLRANGCSFIAYNPLAAGLLTGRHVPAANGEVAQGRFKDNPNYLPRFYTPANFAALAVIRAACEVAGISLVEATYRWLLSHSALTSDDGLLIGASSPAQCEANMAACEAARGEEGARPKPLPPAVLAAIDGVWADGAELREGAFPYWRSYSKDMPGREALPPGASYEASKAKAGK